MNTDELARIVMRAIIALGNQRQEFRYDDGEDGHDIVCLFCGAYGLRSNPPSHYDDCIVLIAQQWMDENDAQ